MNILYNSTIELIYFSLINTRKNVYKNEEKPLLNADRISYRSGFFQSKDMPVNSYSSGKIIYYCPEKNTAIKNTSCIFFNDYNKFFGDNPKRNYMLNNCLINILTFILNKATSVDLSESPDFNKNLYFDLFFDINELVEIGLFKSKKTALKAYKNALSVLSEIYYCKSIDPFQNLSFSGLNRVFEPGNIGSCTCCLKCNTEAFLPENRPGFLHFSENFFSLSFNAKRLLIYFTSALHSDNSSCFLSDCRSNSSQIDFKTSLYHLIQILDLPDPLSEVKTEHPTKDIKRPLLDSISELNNDNFSIVSIEIPDCQTLNIKKLISVTAEIKVKKIFIVYTKSISNKKMINNQEIVL